MSDFGKTIVAKSDQLNSDDLITGPITVKITEIKVNLNNEQQPVAISFTGDNNKPWKPSKSMRRALILKWGDDETKFIGRSITLFRDPTVKYAGKAVGGIVISHMSDIENEERFLLTSSRGQKKPIKIDRIKVKTAEELAQDKLNFANTWVSQSKLEISELDSVEAIKKWQDEKAPAIKSLSKYKDLILELTNYITDCISDFEEAK